MKAAIFRRQRHRPQGFSLAETLISTAITSTALITVLTLLSQGVSNSKDSHQEACAILLARRVAGGIRGQIARAQKTSGSSTGTIDTSLHVGVYDSALQPVAGLDSSGSDASAYATGSPDLNAAYLVSWQVTAPAADAQNVANVTITVEIPPNVPHQNRHSYNYATRVVL